MNKLVIICFATLNFNFIYCQDLPLNPSIKKVKDTHYISAGPLIYKINNDTVQHLYLGNCSDQINKHERSKFLNFDVVDQLILSTEYVNYKKNDTQNPNRFTILLKHPSLGDLFHRDKIRFRLTQYLPKNIGKFYYDIKINSNQNFTFYLLNKNILSIYEIKMAADFYKIESFECKRKIKTQIDDYFNVFEDSNGKYLLSGGTYYEMKHKKLKKLGSYNTSDIFISDTETNLVKKLSTEEVQEILQSPELLNKLNLAKEMEF